MAGLNFDFDDPLADALDFDIFLTDWVEPKDPVPDTDGLFANDNERQHGKKAKSLPVVAAPPAIKLKKSKKTVSRKPKTTKLKIDHPHVCPKHPAPTQESPSATCFGVWSQSGVYKGQRCTHTVKSYEPGFLPVCPRHKTQLSKMVRCEGLLDCHFTCNEMIAWKPHTWPLCPTHIDQGDCYFTKLPTEVRFEIYEYLIPNKDVSAVSTSAPYSGLRHDNVKVAAAMFRVNKAIGDEFSYFLYGTSTFEIQVYNHIDLGIPSLSSPRIAMCRRQPNYVRVTSTSSFLDWSRSESDHKFLRDHPLRKYEPAAQPSVAPQLKDIELTFWKPPVSLNSFRHIRSLIIKLSHFVIHGHTGQTPEVNALIRENSRNIFNDQSHRLVMCLLKHSPPALKTVDIVINLINLNGNEAEVCEKAVEFSKALLFPFKRLRAQKIQVLLVETPDKVLYSSTGTNHKFPEIQFIEEFNRSGTVKDAVQQAQAPWTPTLKIYAQVVKFLSTMSTNGYWRDAEVDELRRLLAWARAAREREDAAGLKDIMANAIKMIQRMMAFHHRFMNSVKQEISILRQGASKTAKTSQPDVVT